jgi:hypothetical protein
MLLSKQFQFTRTLEPSLRWVPENRRVGEVMKPTWVLGPCVDAGFTRNLVVQIWQTSHFMVLPGSRAQQFDLSNLKHGDFHSKVLVYQRVSPFYSN